MGDCGKSLSLLRQLAQYEITAIDHDDFYAELMQSDTALESLDCFKKLPSHVKILIKESTDFVHFGHITHREGGNKIFSRLEDARLLKEATPEMPGFAQRLSICPSVHLCDVAGTPNPQCRKGVKMQGCKGAQPGKVQEYAAHR